MRLPEQKLYDWLVRKVGHRAMLERVENRVKKDTPDLYFSTKAQPATDDRPLTGWIELKCLDAFPVKPKRPSSSRTGPPANATGRFGTKRTAATRGSSSKWATKSSCSTPWSWRPTTGLGPSGVRMACDSTKKPVAPRTYLWHCANSWFNSFTACNALYSCRTSRRWWNKKSNVPPFHQDGTHDGTLSPFEKRPGVPLLHAHAGVLPCQRHGSIYMGI
jgi:hypothetical protein